MGAGTCKNKVRNAHEQNMLSEEIKKKEEEEKEEKEEEEGGIRRRRRRKTRRRGGRERKGRGGGGEREKRCQQVQKTKRHSPTAKAAFPIMSSLNIHFMEHVEGVQQGKE